MSRRRPALPADRRGASRASPRWTEAVDGLIATMLPGIMRRSLQRGLAGIWSAAEAPPPPGGALVVANHHGWWDGYLAWAVAERHRRPFGAVMDDAQLARFRFFRRIGVVSTREPRAAARRAAAGAWLVVFAEGALRPPGPLGPTHGGAAAIARWAGVPVLPLAIRCVMRAADRPEAYLRFGAPMPSGVAQAAVAAELVALLARLDRDVAAAPDPEAPVPGYAAWWPPAARIHERLARWRAWWGAP